MEQTDLGKKIAEIEEILNHPELDFEDWEGITYTKEEAMQFLIDQLKECRRKYNRLLNDMQIVVDSADSVGKK